MTKRMHFYLNYYKELLEKDLITRKSPARKGKSPRSDSVFST